jgi:hypothetical protein
MGPTCEDCPQREVNEVEFRLLDTKLRDLKERVEKLETAISRGLMLLVANLVGIVVGLAQQVMGR